MTESVRIVEEDIVNRRLYVRLQDLSHIWSHPMHRTDVVLIGRLEPLLHAAARVPLPLAIAMRP